jgi:AcrR family transcriptional regulator
MLPDVASKLTRSAVLDATLELAEEEGFEAVSMRGVARRLGVTPMALYRHVGDKQGLLDGLVERLLEELPEPDPALPPLERLSALAGGAREIARRHPEAFLMLMRRPIVTPAAVRRREAIYTALRDLGVPEELVPRVEYMVSTFALGFAASEAGGRFEGKTTEQLDAELAWLEGIMRRLIADG